ncbi:MAG: RNA polymerase sporulation sigma factor SigH [Lachnospiraceae bacterium]|nr:RNA polymerase sporulation sigma factor SigH [Lachnospiraceae bacterium]
MASYESYENMSDEALVAAYRAGENEIIDYLMEKYKYLVRRRAKTLFLIGGDTDDLIQEGMIGLFKAVRDYDTGKDSSFFHFADLCIARQIYTAIEASNRKKHAPLNSYVPLYEENENAGELLIPEVLRTDMEGNPEQMFIDREDMDDFRKKVENRLSAMEQEVLAYYLQGYHYVRIAELMGKEPKSVDNALQRLKKKLR